MATVIIFFIIGWVTFTTLNAIFKVGYRRREEPPSGPRYRPASREQPKQTAQEAK